MANAEAAKDYYANALARADYYASEQEIVGMWRGLGADRLGLSGAMVTQQIFASLVDNRDPRQPDKRLTPRTRSDRRPGYDMNFHCPKGLSVVAALTGDTRIYAAFQQAVTETMLELEQSMQVRVRKGPDAGTNRSSGNLVYGEFMHLTARPVGGEAPDPHLHIHCCVMNASFDPFEQKWKAGEFGGIARDINYYEAAFHSRLARTITGLGYRIKRRSKYWDLADLPEELIEKFTKRTDEINRTAKERGITDAKIKDRLGAETRTAKRRGLTSHELKQAWLAQLTDAEAIAIRAARLRATTSRVGRQKNLAKDHARAAVDFALEHLFERRSVSSDKQIAEAALRHGLGQSVEVEEVWRELDRRRLARRLFRRQVDDQQLCTTREAYEETSRCIEYTRDGMGRCRALAPEWIISRPELLGSSASDQRAAIQHVLSATDRVIAVQGRAGTGKTFATQEIAAALAANGQRLQALAPTSKAVDVLRGEGFAGADTVSQLLVNPQLQQSVAGAVLLVDEAGLLSARQLDRLFQIARDQDCRVLLQYDLSQHRAVERGSPVRDLERHAGLQPVEINVIRRQKREDYAGAVKDLSLGRTAKAFAKLAAMDAFFESQSPEERQHRLAQDYLKATRKPGAKVLVVSPTHREGAEVTKAIRTTLRRAGKLKPEEHETLVLQRIGLTAAQRGEAASYAPEQIIQFTQNTQDHQRGDRLVVKERLSDGTVLVQQSTPSGLGAGSAFVFNLADKDSFDVYEQRRFGFSAGDRIRITQNGYVPVLSLSESSRSHVENPLQSKISGTKKSPGGKKKPERRRLINNAMYEIVRFTAGGDFVLNNGWVLPRDYGHLTCGYCTTSHASQGMTADTVLISQSTESFGAASCQQFYVSCSRGRSGIKIYTDSVAELLRAVVRSDQQLSAADLLAAFPASQCQSRLLPSNQTGELRKHHDSRAERAAAVVRARRNLTGLHVRPEAGVPIITSPKYVPLRTEIDKPIPVVTTLDQTRFVNSVRAGIEWVCGPRPPVDPGALNTSKPFKVTTAGPRESVPVSVSSSAKPEMATSLINSQADDHTQSLSI